MSEVKAAAMSDAGDQTATLSPREELRQQVLTLIKPHFKSTEKPPFSTNDLIVMAFLCSDRKISTRADIIGWITKSFLHYTILAAAEYAKIVHEVSTRSLFDETQAPGVVVEGFYEAFRDFRMPIVQTEMYSQWYSLDLSAARLFLQHHFCAQRKGSFPFLRLPAELRNHIYELVFSFSPGTGLALQKSLTGRHDFAFLRSHPGDARYINSCWTHDYSSGERVPLRGTRDRCEIPPGKEVMSLLAVCKQIYQEAVPFFYQLHPMHIGSMGKLARLALGMASSRLQYITKLSVDLRLKYDCYGSHTELTNFPAAIKSLMQIKDLQKLEIETTDHFWLAMKTYRRKLLGRTTPFKHFGHVPGMKDLAALAEKAGEFKLRGLKDEIAELQKFIDLEIKNIRAQRDETKEGSGTKTGKGRKRKATTDQEDGAVSGKKRTRQTKKASNTQQTGDDD